ncbi:MAG: NAD-dependent succinate-semialdehyde dehydrogenase [Sphingobium sp.]|nr:NAD-dependent succinate-semialdehyde dehydrogenase [Sphingobium sp.]
MTISPTMSLADRSLLREQCFVDGGWIGTGTIPVIDPATKEELASVPDLGARETQAAIEAAQKALPAWRGLLAAERSRILRRWFDLMMDHQADMAMILTLEQGKPLTEAKGEIAYAASFIEWFAEEAKRIYGEVIPTFRQDSRVVTIRQPVGVVAAITPWNFPAAMITRKAAPALAAGCTMIVKPATQTPLTALALAVLAERAGVPKGVFNVVTGSSRVIGAELTSSPIVAKLSFTGSTEVGKTLMAQCAPTMKKLSMELGGNAPFIVFADADLDLAVEGAIASKYRNSGQTCVCANRLLVQREVAQVFEAKLKAAVEKLKVGPGTEQDVAQGPLIDQAALDKVEEHVADALAKGGRLVLGGQRHARGATFFQPTIIADCAPGMTLAREETFGPLAALFPFDSEEDAIALANDTEVGLAGYFYTRDLARAWRVGEALEVGMVGINTGLISTEVAPFGGVKQSGMGREGSRHGIEDYTEIKYLCMAGL